MNPTPEQIAAGLTKADKDALLGDPDRLEASTATLVNLCLLELANIRADNTVFMSDTGLQVRAILRGQS